MVPKVLKSIKMQTKIQTSPNLGHYFGGEK